jgi:two-component system, OmpR family, sensor histidine kinase KdpD
VAEDVEVKRLVRDPGPVVRRDEEGLLAQPEAAPQAIAERLLALATLSLRSERVVRRAWRSAQRLDAELDVLVVRPPGRPPSPEDRKRLEALRRLVSMLGARLRVEEGEDVAAVAIGVARELGITYLLLGTPAERRGLSRLGWRAPGGSPSDRSLLMRLLRGLPGVDVRIVADPSLRRPKGSAEELQSQEGFGGERGEPSGADAPRS